MKCHDMLGVTERSTIEEIQEACSKKLELLETVSEVNASVIHKKKLELYSAKKECIEWKKKTFAERTTSRISEYSVNIASTNRMNECIGPCSCCDWCCVMPCGQDHKSFCVECCGMSCNDDGMSPAECCDIGLYSAGGIAILGYGISFVIREIEKIRNNKKIIIEQEQKEAQERWEQQQKDEDNCRTTLKELLTTANIGNINRATSYIHSGASRVGIDADFALTEAARYNDIIEKAFINSISSHKFDDAKHYIDFLCMVNPQSDKFRKLGTSLNNVSDFFVAQNPYIMMPKYGEVNSVFVNQLKQAETITFTPPTECNLRTLIWKVTLMEPFDSYAYQAVICQLSNYHNLGLSIDVIASMIYVDAVFGEKVISSINPYYSKQLNSVVINGTVNYLQNIASFAAWCGNKRVEATALKRLNDKGNLSDELKKRYNTLRNY